jgi:hypothetical protein
MGAKVDDLQPPARRFANGANPRAAVALISYQPHESLVFKVVGTKMPPSYPPAAQHTSDAIIAPKP